jgi:membrane protein DedA with SNARE-associated domain
MSVLRPMLSLAEAVYPAFVAHIGITEKLTQFAEWLVAKAHYPGAFVLMALESMIAPIPSEAVMPFVGFAVQNGQMKVVPAIVVTSIASIVGSLISYWLGWVGGKPLVMKVGKYLLINEQHLDWTIAFFHKRSGTWTIFIGRFVPVIRHFISIPAGIGKMPLVPFCLATLIGATMWNSFLLYLGYAWHSHIDELRKYYKMMDVAVIVVGVMVVAGWFYLHLRTRPAKADIAPNLPSR